MKIRILKTHPNAKEPTYATEGAACFDLYAVDGAWVSDDDTQSFRTGLSFEVPDGFAMLVYSRSGHGFKNGIRLVNSVGVIDSDYRGEVMVKLRNDGEFGYCVEAGDRIAQAYIVPVPKVEFEVAEQLSITERGTGGFGSSGA